MLRIDNLSTIYNIYITKFFLNDLKENFKGGLKKSLNIIIHINNIVPKGTNNREQVVSTCG